MVTVMRCFFVLIVAMFFASIADTSISHRRRLRNVNLGIRTTLKDESRNFTRWFTQTLDHFNLDNSPTWQQRYFVNDEFFDINKRNVAFIKVGEETELDEFWMTNGDWVENGRKFKAILFNLEQRFYGQSRPTKNLSVQNLKYLTIEQALADLATFISAMNKEYKLSADVKWIAFGGSYSGELAAWARLKYPNIIRGAVSSSAPILKVLNYAEYYKVVADDLRNVNKDCPSAVQKAFAQIDSLIQNKAGQKSLTSMFQLCDPLEDSADDGREVANVYSMLASNFAVVAQYNKDNIDGEASKITLDTACNIMTNSSEPKEIKRLAAFNALMNKASGLDCTDFKYSKWIAQLRNTSWTGTNDRQWNFQTCTEIGEFQTSDGKPQIFSDKFPLHYSIVQCMDIFGPQFNQSHIEAGIKRINTLYGALNINVTNVVFVHGSVDPFHKLGITKTANPSAPAIFIEGTAHCADIYPSREDDLPQLKAARVQITKLIQSWLTPNIPRF